MTETRSPYPFALLRVRVPLIRGVTTGQWREHIRKALLDINNPDIRYKAEDIAVYSHRKRNPVAWFVTSTEKRLHRVFMLETEARAWAESIDAEGLQVSVVPLVVGRIEA
jgi:hypothetical protein